MTNALVHFWGGRAGINSVISDKAPEFLRALRDLNIAPFEGTPGRDTSHGVIERANLTALELGRPALHQSGLGMSFASKAIKHALLQRRLTVCNGDGLSIYVQKHGDTIVAPVMWPSGGQVIFKPTPTQMVQDKVAPRGRDGILVGYVMNPGGSWT